MKCPECGSEAKLVESTVVYKKDYGWLWVCENYPRCNTYCGCHNGTKKPLGMMAGPELRIVRMKVHKRLDRLWKTGQMSRQEAYRWLADEMAIEISKCHVGMFDYEQCNLALACLYRLMPEKKVPSVEVVGRNYIPSQDSSPPF